MNATESCTKDEFEGNGVAGMLALSSICIYYASNEIYFALQ